MYMSDNRCTKATCNLIKIWNIIIIEPAVSVCHSFLVHDILCTVFYFICWICWIKKCLIIEHYICSSWKKRISSHCSCKVLHDIFIGGKVILLYRICNTIKIIECRIKFSVYATCIYRDFVFQRIVDKVLDHCITKRECDSLCHENCYK